MVNQGEEEGGAPVVQQIRLDQLQFEAMMAEITRTLRRDFDLANQTDEWPQGFDPNAGLEARGGRMAHRGRFGRGARMGVRRGPRQHAPEEHTDASEGSGEGSLEGGAEYPNNRRFRAEDNLCNLKLRIPPFTGKNDPDAYLEWEKKIEMVFSCQQYTEAKKVKLAASGFSGHAVHWWDQIAFTRRSNGESQIASWFEMKFVMKKRFASGYDQFGYVQVSSRQRRSQVRSNRSRSARDESEAKAVRKQIPRRLFVESVVSNNEEKNEVSETSSSPNEATVSRRLFGTEKFSNDSITGKCFLPSSQTDSMHKGKKICRDLTICEPVSPSSLVLSSQDFEEEIPGEVPKKVPPARGMEILEVAKDAIGARGKREMSGPLPNSFEGKASVAEGEFNKDPFFVPSVGVLDETCIGFTNLKPVQPSIREFSLQDHEDKLPEKTPRRLSLDSKLASTASWEFKPFTHSFIGERRLKLCKDIGVPSSLPSLFVLVTTDEEKQFGLENVKELCVSGFVFDEIIQYCATSKHEMFSRPECSLIAETLDFKFASSHKLIRRTLGHKLFEIDANLMIDECFSNKVLHNLKSIRTGCETVCCENFWVLKPCDMNSALKENVFGSFSKLDHEFALLELWFRNMRDILRAKRRSEFEYVETASKLAQFNLFPSNYISLCGLCSKEKFCSSECSNARMIYDLILDGDSRNLNLVFKVLNPGNSVVYFCCTFDMVFLVFEKKQDRQVMEFVQRTRRIQGLDKQVDYGPKEHLSKEWCQNRASTGRPQQSYQFGDWIWDHTKQPLPTLQGKHLFDHTSNEFNLFSCVADELDLRSNPFKGGGDGVILERPDEIAKQFSQEEDSVQMEPAQVQQGQTASKEENEQSAQGKLDQTTHEEEEENPAQLEKTTSSFASKAQEGELSNWLKGPITRFIADTQRKPILQVAWAWLRRKRKPRRVNQLGLV